MFISKVNEIFHIDLRLGFCENLLQYMKLIKNLETGIEANRDLAEKYLICLNQKSMNQLTNSVTVMTFRSEELYELEEYC